MPNHTDPGLSALIPAVLTSINHSLGAELSAEVSSESGRVLLDMMRRLLRWAITEIEMHGALYESRIYAEAALLPDSGGHTARTGGAARGPVGLFSAPTSAEQAYFEEVGYLAAALRREVGEAHRSPSKRTSLAERLNALISAETKFYAAFDPESASDIGSAYNVGKSDNSDDIEPVPMTVTIETLNDYLRQKFPAHPTIAASNLRKLAGGMSKDTIMFEVAGHPDYCGPLVIRKDLAELSLDVSAVDEFSLLKAIHAAGVAAPEPLWAEPDPNQLGTRFIVVRRARGSVAISQDISDDKIRRHFADRLAAGLAAIHLLHIPDHNLFKSVAGKSMDQTLREQLETWRSFWMRKRREPSIKMEIVFAWLEVNIPSNSQIPPSLVHGDYGFHNLIMDQGEVTAILDWEFAHMGDPAEDVNYCRQFIERYVPFEYFLERYLAYGGKPYDAARDRYFTVWRNCRNAIACLGSLHAFVEASPGNIKTATAGLAYNPRFELEALRLVTGFLGQ